MSSIEQLPANVVNKIAAGEVIERPASVVKELIENSVDSGATRIDVEIEQGGSGLIRVVDDGSGIAGDQLLLALTSHATSKIRSDEDLFRVRTLGFRGEALASIAAVSRMQIRSRTPAASGAQIETTHPEEPQVTPCGCPLGTTVEVRDLFFNTPVRRKFLRTTQTEIGHITESFSRLALAYPAIHFTLSHNSRVLHELPPADSRKGRIRTFFGDDLADGLIEVYGEDEELRVSGYAADPGHSRGNNRMQFLFLNGRFIRDRSLQHALNEAYRGLLMTGRYPICFLTMQMPAEMVDVNVHPTKLEVRFQDGGRIYSHLLGTLRTQFLNTDLTAKVQTGHASPSGESGANSASRPTSPTDSGSPFALPTSLAGPNAGDETSPAHVSEFRLPAHVVQGLTTESHPLSNPHALTQGGNRLTHFTERPPAADLPNGIQSHRSEPAGATESAAAMQVLNRYLIAESPDGVLVIDQHALHERILYEEIRTKVLAKAVETQALLVPEPVDLSPAEAASVLGQTELLEQLGIRVEAFGGDTVLISSYPAMLANWSPAELLRTVAEQLTSAGKAPERRDLLDELLHMISCKAAIKAGDRLSPTEVEALLQQRELARDAHHCPHGRPTALVFTREELDKRFKRT